MKIQIVILNYRGEKLLPQCLPSIVKAAGQSPYPCRTVILDNPSEADGLDYVRQAYPQVEIVRAAENKVLCSYNDYLAGVTDEVVILLNNDIRVDENFIAPLIKPFENSKTFLAAPKVMTFDGAKVENGASRAEMRFGMFWCSANYPGFEKHADMPGMTYTSGFGAFRTEVFNRLGGYDERYLPGIFEDVDLSLRAQKAGYELVYVPQSVVYHMGQSTFKEAFRPKGVEILAARNSFLFMWKNFSGPEFWIPHIFWLPFRFLFNLLRGKTALWTGFCQALQRQRKVSR